MICAACEGKLRRDAYRWTIRWDRPEGYAKRKFEVSFDIKPACIKVMTDRLDDYAWEQGMAAALEETGVDFGYGDDIVEYTPKEG